MIYSVYYSNGGGNLDVLNDLSKVTGGRVFTVSPPRRSSRSTRTSPPTCASNTRLATHRPTAPNRYHKIDLRTADNTLIVQAREGYFTPK